MEMPELFALILRARKERRIKSFAALMRDAKVPPGTWGNIKKGAEGLNSSINPRKVEAILRVLGHGGGGGDRASLEQELARCLERAAAIRVALDVLREAE